MQTIIRNIMSYMARKSRCGRLRRLAAVLAAALIMNYAAPVLAILTQAAVKEADDNTATASNYTATPSDAQLAVSVAAAEAEDTATIHIEAEKYYNKSGSFDGVEFADLQPDTEISIPLEEAAKENGFKAGNYRIQIRYCGMKQLLGVESGEETSQLACSEIGWQFTDDSIMECLNVMVLSEKNTLTLKAATADTYGWIDWIELEPVDEKQIRVQAKDYVAPGDKVTGNHGSCANMDPGVKVEITLDDRFEKGQYGLLLTGTGNDRTYEVLVNGESAGSYSISGSDWSDFDLHHDGWQGSYNLKAGDTVTILAPDGSYGWLKDVVWRWEAGEDPGPAGGVTIDGETYIFEAENYYFRATQDGQGADMQPNTKLQIDLADIPDFKQGNYLVQVVYAGNGQIMPLTAGDVSAELIFSPGDWAWEDMTAESMDIFSLNGSETLTLHAVTGERYTWIDKVVLIPAAGKRIRLNVKDSAVKAELLTGDQNSCANMDPGTTITMTLDQRFAAGAYELMLFHAGFARNYTIMVNGEEADSYQAAGNGNFGMDQFLSNGWQGYYELKPGDIVTLKAPGSEAGWIKDIVWQSQPSKFYQKDEATGIIVEAEEGVIPENTKLSVKALGKVGQDDFSDEDMRATGYQIRLIHNGRVLDLTADGKEDAVKVTIPIPAGCDKESDSVDLFYKDDDAWESLMAENANDGKALATSMPDCGIYAVSMERGLYHYEAEDYYNAWADDGNAANFETGNGESIIIPLKQADGFSRGIYNLLVKYCGGGSSSLTIKINGEYAGYVPVTYTGDDSWGDYRLSPASGVLNLSPGKALELTVPRNQYHWIDYVQLTEAEPFEASMDGVHVEAKIGSLPMGAQLAVEEAAEDDPYLEELNSRFRQLGAITARYIYFCWGEERENRISPATPVTVRMELPDGMKETDRYCLYYLSGSDPAIRCTKIPSTIEDGMLVFSIREETGLFALVEGAASLPVGFEDRADEIYGRMGARVAANTGESASKKTETDVFAGRNQVLKTRTDGSHYYYEGEGYYRAQFDSLTGDLQPGAQMRIKLSDNRDFKGGQYTLTVRSNGNRQKLIVKVNNQIAGNVLRKETSFDMASMTEDTMTDTLSLLPSDLLTIEGETGNYYGWVDYVKLTRVSEASVRQEEGKAVSYNGAKLYEKQVESCQAADLQPGDTLSFRVGDNSSFAEGAYQIAVTSNGNRTRLWVKVNGQMAGSIVRASGSGFDRYDFTTDVMHHTLNLLADDVISLEAPGNAEDGPWGWIETIQLIPAPKPSGEQKEEYRYEGEDFYQASLYSPAADLQPTESIVIPVNNDPDFAGGYYRLSIMSNGTRERFLIRLNDVPVGTISRKATGYGDIDYSQDYLDVPLAIQPGDVLTVTGQDGDFFGWVNYVLLEQADQ